MAQSQHVAAKQRSRRRHQTRSPSPSRHHDWDSRQAPNPHSLPYRPRVPEIHRFAGRNLKIYPHPAAQLSEDDSDDSDPMPIPQQQLTRPAAVGSRNGKGRAVFLEVEDDDDDNAQMISRLRSRSRPRTQSKTRSVSSSGDDETYELSTPPRSTPAYRSRPTSRLPSPSSSRSSSVDSDSSDSTEDERARRRARKRPVAVPLTPPPPSADRAESSRRHRRRHRSRSAFRDDSDDEPDYSKTLRLRERSKSVPRERLTVGSRSTSRKPHHRRGRYEEAEASTSRRPHRRRYYDSDYAEKPALARAHTAPGSHVTTQRFQSPPEKPAHMVECVSCFDDLPSTKTAKLKCGHRMCKPCLKRSFKLSIKDPAHMPPRCCTSDCIPLKHVENIFDVEFKKNWNRKFHEYSTQNRVYCPGKRCGRWIRPDQIKRHQNGRRVGRCGSCHTRVCCECNSKWHGSTPCLPDEETNQILQQAKEEGWQRCYNCKNMVELKEGCNHMTCRCGAEFCMICGLKWKTCECPWFNYDGADADHLDHMQIPEPMIDRERLGLRTAPLTQGVDARRSPGNGLRTRQSSFQEDVLLKRLQEQRDEELARRLQFEDSEDEYMDPAEETIGLGNTGNFMNSGYRRRAQTVVAPPAPAPPPVAPFGATSVTDYVTGVNRARGVRASSMERRLADRFESRAANASPTHNTFGHGIPPPPVPPRAMGPPPPPPQPSMGPTPMLRRHTIDDEDLFDPRAGRLPERMLPRRATTRSYIEDPTFYEPGPRIRRRERAASVSPRDSALAGLTGPGRGMHRVYEWVNHVESDPTALAT